MFKKMLAVFTALFMSFMSVQMAAAATVPEKEAGALAMVDRVVALLEAEGMDALAAAATDPSNTDFFDGELYVIVFDYDGLCAVHGANPKLMGKNLKMVKDTNGLVIADAMAEVALNQGSGWVDYQWTNPATDKVGNKTTFVRDLGNGHYVGVGFYN